MDINELAENIATIYKRNIIQNNKVATGELSNFEYYTEFNDNHYKVIFELPEYYKFVELGRRAGSYPPINKIRDWIQIKPIIPYANSNGKVPTTNQLAFLISHSIFENGIKPVPLLKKTLEESQQFIDEFVESVKGEIKLLIINELKNIKK